jgi:RNA polymerase sigma-70 factor, ECF subfamily
MSSIGPPETVSGDTSRPAEAGRSTWSSLRLFQRAKGGHASALNRLFQRNLAPVMRWAHGRLPKWARTVSDTADLVQDAMLQTFRRLNGFEVRGPRALQAYLRQAVQNRINDELRRIGRRGVMRELPVHLAGADGSPLDAAVAAETSERYKTALMQLSRGDRELIVGRFELGLSYEQLALACDRSSPDSARMAVQRALVRLTDELRRG